MAQLDDFHQAEAAQRERERAERAEEVRGLTSGLGLRVWVPGFRVQGSGFRV